RHHVGRDGAGACGPRDLRPDRAVRLRRDAAHGERRDARTPGDPRGARRRFDGEMTARRPWAVFRSRRMIVLFVLGFSSGIPLYLTGQTLQAWMTAVGIDVNRISAFAAVGLAYTFKFAWAPLLDRYRLPLLGRRRGWVLATQIGLLVAIAA